jgi:hypothetical protein
MAHFAAAANVLCLFPKASDVDAGPWGFSGYGFWAAAKVVDG